MKRLLIVLVLAAFVAPLGAVEEPQQAILDPCAICGATGHPGWCFLCAVDMWWDSNGCFPGEPGCEW